MNNRYGELHIINPPFDSPVTDLIIDIDFLRRRRIYGTTQPHLFFQIKHIFHILESIGSARIEGNHTTIAEYIDSEIDHDSNSNDESLMEIRNNEKALNFIEENIDSTPINRAFISEIHKLVVSSLSRKGSSSPGVYRMINPRIIGSSHIPPEAVSVDGFMEELLTFINRDHPNKYDLLKIAIAHHRFVWIHPFDNGNGRTVRLLTYAMMIKSGFRVDTGRIINPTAVFCSDRNAYYDALSQADKGTEKGLLAWSQYMLTGLKVEIEKIDRLLEYDFVSSRILLPALANAHRKRIISDEEQIILSVAVKEQEFKTTYLNKVFQKKSSVSLSRSVRRLRDKGFLVPIQENSRTYVLNFLRNELMREIM